MRGLICYGSWASLSKESSLLVQIAAKSTDVFVFYMGRASLDLEDLAEKNLQEIRGKTRERSNRGVGRNLGRSREQESLKPLSCLIRSESLLQSTKSTRRRPGEHAQATI